MFNASGLSSHDVRTTLKQIGRNDDEINKLFRDAINSSEGTMARGKIILLMDVESFTYTLYIKG